MDGVLGYIIFYWRSTGRYKCTVILIFLEAKCPKLQELPLNQRGY